MEYIDTLEDGTVFDSSENRKTPLEFEVGSGRVIAGFDQAVMGMKKGEQKKFTLQPSEAYGERNSQLTQIVGQLREVGPPAIQGFMPSNVFAQGDAPVLVGLKHGEGVIVRLDISNPNNLQFMWIHTIKLSRPEILNVDLCEGVLALQDSSKSVLLGEVGVGGLIELYRIAHEEHIRDLAFESSC